MLTLSSAILNKDALTTAAKPTSSALGSLASFSSFCFGYLASFVASSAAFDAEGRHSKWVAISTVTQTISLRMDKIKTKTHMGSTLLTSVVLAKFTFQLALSSRTSRTGTSNFLNRTNSRTSVSSRNMVNHRLLKCTHHKCKCKTSTKVDR